MQGMVTGTIVEWLGRGGSLAAGSSLAAAGWLRRGVTPWCLLVILLLVVLGQAVMMAWMRRQRASGVRAYKREQRFREELEAYARLDASTAQEMSAGMEAMEATRALAKRVCTTVAEKSAFSQVTMILRDAEGRFSCMGSAGVDDLTVAALHDWGERVVAKERGGLEPEREELEGGELAGHGREGHGREGWREMLEQSADGAKSFSISLGKWSEFDQEVGSWALSGRRERRRWRRVLVAPVWTRRGKMMGAIAVCSDGAGVRLLEGGEWPGGLEGAMGPIEALAAKLSRMLENDALADKLLRAEKMAGLGQLAGGVAHALNNPLTAVLGFAELIAETAADARVRNDARTIQAEALKMKETVQKLVEFWRPVTLADEPVDVMSMLHELEQMCAEKLEVRGVRLEIKGAQRIVPVRGSGERLRQVFEHLLNNAAQAIGAVQAIGTAETVGAADAQHTIRVTVSQDEHALQLIVSDTGGGFRDPMRVFDPFYTTRQPGEGAGLGLSLCYGIVREHGGEISAFNLYPRGAAVVVELPVKQAVRSESQG